MALDIDQPIFIVGVPRSGTSLIAGLLADMGVWAGAGPVLAPDTPRLPTGAYAALYENEALKDGLHKPLLQASYVDPAGVEPRGEWEDFARVPDIAGSVKAIIHEQGYKAGAWMFKDCKMLLSFPVWHKAFPNARWIFVRRRAADIVRSCLKTPFMAKHSPDAEFWKEFSDDYTDRMQWAADSGAWFRQINAQDVAEGRYDDLRAVVEELGLEWSDPSGLFDPTAWKGTKEGEPEPIFQGLVPNMEATAMLENVKASLARDLPMARFGEGVEKFPSREAVVCAGGPSLKRQLGAIRKAKKRGAFVLAINNCHDYLIGQGIVPHAMAMMDSREDNARFVENPRRGVTYYIAGKVHPAVFDALEGHDVRLWQVRIPGIIPVLEADGRLMMRLLGGSTMGLLSLTLCMSLGFQVINWYGMDSCKKEGAHHAYPQTLNDGETDKIVTLNGREFTCSGWMIGQAQDFQQIAEGTGEGVLECTQRPHPDFIKGVTGAGVVLLIVHGNGLLAHMINEGAKITQEKAHAQERANANGSGERPDQGAGGPAREAAAGQAA